jgi:hypothetical protein
MSRYFLFPFRYTGLMLVATFTLGLLFCVRAGFIGIFGDLLFISWFFKYCFVVLDAVIAGAEEPPVLDLDMVNPVGEQRPLAQAAIIACGVILTLWIGRSGGERWAYLVGAILLFALPASIAVMSISGNPLLAAWPPQLIRLIRGTRWHYLIPVAMMMVALLAAAWMMAVGVSLWLWIAAAQMLLLLTFSLVGGVVHENRLELGIDTLTRQEREAARDEREHLSARSQMLDRAYGKFNARQPLEGWNVIQEWLSTHPDGDRFMEHRAILTAASAWPDVRPADRLANDLIGILLARGRTGEALEVVEARLATNPQFRPAQETHTARLAELAGFAGKRALRRLLDPTFQDRG